MKIRYALTISIFPLLLGAVTIPQASSKPAVNLQNYLKFQLEDRVSFTCKGSSSVYVCESSSHSIKDENTTLNFKKALFRFDTALNPQLKKSAFAKTVKEISKTQKQSNSKNYMSLNTPLEDLLNRAMADNLKYISIDKLDIKNTNPKSHVKIENISYENSMKKSDGGVSFKERIFGKAKLKYTDAYFDEKDSVSIYQLITQNLEKTFKTDNKIRSSYVSQKLEKLYAKQLSLPVSGEIDIFSRYIKNNAISIDVKAENSKSKESSSNFTFKGELRNASALFESQKATQSGGMPDFLFKSINFLTYNNADSYRNLLKKDKKFASYISEYDTLIQNYFDKETKSITKNATVKKWLTQTKSAFSKILQAKAQRLDISIINKSGASAMEFFGMLMGKMMAPPANGKKQTSQEDVIADIAAKNFIFEIKAY